MRRDEQRLADILEALDSVAKITLGLSESAFLADETVRFAVAHRLTVAGEAVARLSPENAGSTRTYRGLTLPDSETFWFTSTLVFTGPWCGKLLRSTLRNCGGGSVEFWRLSSPRRLRVAASLQPAPAPVPVPHYIHSRTGRWRRAGTSRQSVRSRRRWSRTSRCNWPNYEHTRRR